MTIESSKSQNVCAKSIIFRATLSEITWSTSQLTPVFPFNDELSMISLMSNFWNLLLKYSLLSRLYMFSLVSTLKSSKPLFIGGTSSSFGASCTLPSYAISREVRKNLIRIWFSNHFNNRFSLRIISLTKILLSGKSSKSKNCTNAARSNNNQIFVFDYFYTKCPCKRTRFIPGEKFWHKLDLNTTTMNCILLKKHSSVATEYLTEC